MTDDQECPMCGGSGGWPRLPDQSWVRCKVCKKAEAPRLARVHPGSVLASEFLQPAGLSARSLARDLGWPANRVTEIVAGKRRLTAESAVALALRFGTTAEFWMNLQSTHDLEVAGYVREVPVVGVVPSDG